LGRHFDEFSHEMYASYRFNCLSYAQRSVYTIVHVK
jgi:hypothetical protein